MVKNHAPLLGSPSLLRVYLVEKVKKLEDRKERRNRKVKKMEEIFSFIPSVFGWKNEKVEKQKTYFFD